MPSPHVASAPEAVATGASGATVLVVEDDATHRRMLHDSLLAAGYRVTSAASAAEVTDVLRDVVPDLVLLDLGLPDADGVDLCRRLTSWPAAPIVVVSADHDAGRIVEALDAGAGDYVTKPFSVPVLLARLRVAQRGPVPNGATSRQPWSVGDLRLDPAEHQAWAAGSPVAFRAREFAVLELLMRNRDQLVPYSALTGRPRGADVPANELNALRIVVSRVRTAIGVGPHRPTIDTEARFGYRLVGPVD